MREIEDFKAAESRRWLDYVSTIKPRIANCDNMLEVVRRLAEPKGIDYAKPYVMSSPSKDVVADTVAAMEELMVRWGDERTRLTCELDEALEVIYRLENPLHCDLLVMRYVDGWSWRDVAGMLAYSEDHCYELHNRAAVELHRHLPSGWRTEFPEADQ